MSSVPIIGLSSLLSFFSSGVESSFNGILLFCSCVSSLWASGRISSFDSIASSFFSSSLLSILCSSIGFSSWTSSFFSSLGISSLNSLLYWFSFVSSFPSLFSSLCSSLLLLEGISSSWWTESSLIWSSNTGNCLLLSLFCSLLSSSLCSSSWGSSSLFSWTASLLSVVSLICSSNGKEFSLSKGSLCSSVGFMFFELVSKCSSYFSSSLGLDSTSLLADSLFTIGSLCSLSFFGTSFTMGSLCSLSFFGSSTNSSSLYSSSLWLFEFIIEGSFSVLWTSSDLISLSLFSCTLSFIASSNWGNSSFFSLLSSKASCNTSLLLISSSFCSSSWYSIGSLSICLLLSLGISFFSSSVWTFE